MDYGSVALDSTIHPQAEGMDCATRTLADLGSLVWFPESAGATNGNSRRQMLLRCSIQAGRWMPMNVCDDDQKSLRLKKKLVVRRTPGRRLGARWYFDRLVMSSGSICFSCGDTSALRGRAWQSSAEFVFRLCF